MTASATVDTQPDPGATRSAWITFAVCAAAIYITALDLSVVNVAFPDIVSDFGITRADASWIVTIYNIFYGSLLVVAGKTADQLGRKRLFLAGIAAFAAGSAIAAFAPNLAALLAGRVLQGIGGAMLTPASLGLLLAAFPTSRRTQIIAMWGGIGALGIASGPSLGAFAISVFDWRAAFWINLPICAALAAATIRTITESPRLRSAHRPDYAGAALVTISLASVVLAISQSEVWGITDTRTLASFAGGIVLIPIFVQRQRTHPEPVLDLALFDSRSFSVANLSGLAFFGGFAAIGLNNVLFLREVWGYTVLEAGLISAIAPATVALLAPISGRFAARIGFRPFVTTGPILIAATMTVYAQFGSEPQPLRFIALGQLVAIGAAAYIPINSAAAVADLAPTRLSIGGAINNTFRQIGSALGIALLVAFLGTPATPDDLLDAYHRGWYVVAALTLAAGLTGLAQQKRKRTAPSVN